MRAFIDHAYWGLDKLLEALEPLTDDELDRDVIADAAPARQILLHMYRFEAGWLARLNGDDPPPARGVCRPRLAPHGLGASPPGLARLRR